MNCPKCHSANVEVTLEEVSSKTKKTGVGLGGHLHNAARAYVAVGTLGLSNLVIKKATGEEKTVVKNGTFGVCQNCGYSWKIK